MGTRDGRPRRLPFEAGLGCELAEALCGRSEDALIAWGDAEHQDVLQAVAGKADSCFLAVMHGPGLSDILGSYGQQEPRSVRERQHLEGDREDGERATHEAVFDKCCFFCLRLL